MDATLKMKECDTMRILVVEDDRLLNNTLCYNLDAAGYVVDSALTKSAASNFLTKQDYDLIVLDVNLPGQNILRIFCQDFQQPVFQWSEYQRLTGQGSSHLREIDGQCAILIAIVSRLFRQPSQYHGQLFSVTFGCYTKNEGV